jgi:hypothetical protein
VVLDDPKVRPEGTEVRPQPAKPPKTGKGKNGSRSLAERLVTVKVSANHFQPSERITR